MKPVRKENWMASKVSHTIDAVDAVDLGKSRYLARAGAPGTARDTHQLHIAIMDADGEPRKWRLQWLGWVIIYWQNLSSRFARNVVHQCGLSG
jgi:hypothetical protein